MSGVQIINVEPREDGLRVDRWFKGRFPGLGHGRLEKLLRKGQVRVDGGRVKASTRLAQGQSVRVPPLPDDHGSPYAPPKRTAKRERSQDGAFLRDLVIHKDDDVIAINKPAGLAVQGGSRTDKHIDGMLDALAFDAPERPRLVHRLDKDTSGVLLLARSRDAAAKLGRALKHHDTRKIYWALTMGVPRPQRGTINMALAKAGGEGREKVHAADDDSAGARNAITHYAVVSQAAQKFAWVAFMPVTGRTHQIRAHAVALGTPIVGDGKYGGADAHPGGEIPRMMHLHARELTIRHPLGNLITVTAPLPEHMRATWKLMGLNPNDDENPFAELDA
ncbi:RluA family pseudouridine synthase [Pyruvatibacter sp.]|uniref:RluA family pseudouridine synthase n=1 Tax=Pyruvatibacter sp. TaxID=1981328 RepID=UPI0032EDA610